jgi:VCBS repeat-containing protein
MNKNIETKFSNPINSLFRGEITQPTTFKIPTITASILSLGLVFIISLNWFSVVFAQATDAQRRPVSEAKMIGFDLAQNESSLDVRVASSSDDAEERASGSVSLTSSDLELVLDADIQNVGLRFNGITIPQGANITSAYLQFQTDETNSEATTLTIQGQADSNPLAFTNSTNDITDRALTTANVGWSPAPWTTRGHAGPDQQTPDISTVIQEIVNQPGWSDGNSLVIIITGSGKRVAESYDGTQAGAPLLHVEYTTGPPNNPPIAIDDAHSTNEDVDLTIVSPGVLANDNDVDGDALTAVVDTLPSNGTLSLNSDGSFTYLPDPNFDGTDSFTYLVNDGIEDSNPATVTITVNPINDNPVSVDDTGMLTQGGTLNMPAPGVLGNDNDPDGDALVVTATPVSPPSYGTLTLNPDGSYTYIHDGTATTSDSFVYQACDSASLCDIASVLVTISPPEPTTFEVRVETSSDDAEERATGTVSLTSSDLELVLDLDIQTVGLRFNGITIPQGANITSASIQFQTDETNSETTTLTFHGEAASNPLTFTSSTNDIINRALTNANVEWTPVPWTTVGEAGPDQQTPDISAIIQEIVNLPNWSDGNSLVIIISGNGKRVAEAYDGVQAGAPLLHVEYNSGPTNNPPVVNDDNATTPEDISVFIDVAANDSDPDGSLNLASTNTNCAGCTETTNGNLLNNGDGTFNYTPNLNYNGPDSFVYEICDTYGSCNTATVSIIIEPIADPPVAADDTGVVTQGATLNEAAPGVLSNDSDPDGDLLSISLNPVSPPSYGNLTLNADGSYSYTHDGSQTTSDSFVYQVCDSAQLCDTATVNISITLATPTIFEVRVAASSDDAEERAAGSVSLTSSDLELVFDTDIQTVGLRFNGVTIPQGANITSAFIQFQTDETHTEVTTLNIHGQADGNALTFTSSTNNITNRTLTTSNVGWTPNPWTITGEAGPDQQTTDIAPVIQEIVNLEGWSEGNSLAIIITGTGKRVAEAFDGVQAGAPLLHVDYMVDNEPQIMIITPPDGATFSQGDAINFTANASDIEDGDLTANISWESSIDGVIGTGGSFLNANLALGIHTITASATDSSSQTGTDQITISVTTPGGNLPPVVSAWLADTAKCSNCFMDYDQRTRYSHLHR